MKKIYIAIISLLLSDVGLQAQEQDTVRLTLKEAINLAQMQSVDAAVALNELKTAYWEYRTHVADQLPEINFKGTLPAYSKQYTKYQQSDGSYTFVQNNSLGLSGEISIDLCNFRGSETTSRNWFFWPLRLSIVELWSIEVRRNRTARLKA